MPRQLSQCPLCAGRRLRYAFAQEGQRAVRCADCQLLLLNPQSATGEGTSASSEQASALLGEWKKIHGTLDGRLLLVGREDSPLRRQAEKLGLTVSVTQVPAAFDGCDFDFCVLDHSLARAPEPLAFLRSCHAALKVGGALAIATPTLTFTTPEFERGDLFHFDRRTIETALFLAGFGEVLVADHHVLSRAQPLRERPLLSVVVPAFNEAGSLREMMEALLAKQVPGVDLEIILVESNSTDGTREIARSFASYSRVRLVLEDKPRGKGRAVRTGLEYARGDFVLIQDADLEYDLEDYDALLEPLVSGHEAFVLGSRHSGSVWKMRQFSGQALLSGFLNGGHWFFTTLVNVLFGQRLKDPFTMYKVFRRDCLFGLRFECNRFDFDYELLVKLIRKGYQPRELPVNYRSRSFKEGKKVSMFRDPLTWLWALLKLRLAKIDPLGEVALDRAPKSEQAPASESSFAHARAAVD